MFIDRAKVYVKAGNGGNGCISFRREAYAPKGGPDGGNGGKGGSIFFIADSQLHTLLDFHYKPRYSAQPGQHGQGSKRSGKAGEDMEVRVPIGTRIFDGETLLADLAEEGQQFCVAAGGKGGRGNSEFATPRNRTPRKATDGKSGEEHELFLELKLMADVGLVGLPNAGKSTLLSVLTAARPKIAPYPFTTLHPNLGIVQPTEYDSFVLADIPGLIEGASDGKGLGYEFLRHIERTRVLVYLIDASSEHGREDLKILKAELKRWNADLVKRPSIVVLSKIDLLGDESVPKGPWRHKISSATGEGLESLVGKLWKMLETAPIPEIFRTPDFTSSRKEDDPELIDEL